MSNHDEDLVPKVTVTSEYDEQTGVWSMTYRDGEPLVAGGQGRDEKDQFTTLDCLLVVLVGVIMLLVSQVVL